MSNTRFTAWLSSEERDALRSIAKAHSCSENMVLRMALRSMLFGVPIPEYLKPKEGTNNEVRATAR